MLWVAPASAASIDRARQVLAMVYDIGLYNSELDRIMNEADTRGIYGGAGSTPTSRMRDKTLTHASMQAQRDAVLIVASTNLAERATDAQLSTLLQMAAGGAEPSDRRLVEDGVANVKSSFSDALWGQLAVTARGNSMFPCTNNARNRC